MGCVNLINPPEAGFSKMDKNPIRHYNRLLVKCLSPGIPQVFHRDSECQQTFSKGYAQGTGVLTKTTGSSSRENDIRHKRSKKSTYATGIYEILKVGLERGRALWIRVLGALHENQGWIPSTCIETHSFFNSSPRKFNTFCSLKHMVPRHTCRQISIHIK